MLGHFLSFKDENDKKLSDDQIADNIIGVLFAAQDTTASVITWVLKFLHDDPKLLEAVKVKEKYSVSIWDFVANFIIIFVLTCNIPKIITGGANGNI